MKKMAKRFFSSVIVLAMLMALLPASVANAAVIESRDFEDAADLTSWTTGTYGGSAYSLDETVSYNGKSSMKAVQSSQYSLTGLAKTYEHGKTYRISARVKIDNPDNVAKTINFETWADANVYANTKMSWGGSLASDSLRVRSSSDTIADSEWHLLTREFTFTKKTEDAAAKFSVIIGIETQNSTDTFWVDDFSIVEILSVDANKKGSYIAYKSFDGPSLELANATATKDTTTAYEGAASAKVTSTGSVVNFGTYNFEVGQIYRVSSYIKADYPEGNTSEGSFKYEFRNNKSGLGGVVSVSSKYNSSPEKRPGFSLNFMPDEQYPGTGTGWSRLGTHPINANDTGWLRHESYFKVNSTDASITNADLQVWLWTGVPSGTVINIDSVKIEKCPTLSAWFGTIEGVGMNGGEIYRSGANYAGSGLATVYYLNTAGGDNHSVQVPITLEKGKKYRASAKVYVPSSNKATVDALNLATPAQTTFGTTKMDVVYDKWVDISFDIDWTNKETTTDRYGLNGISASIAKKFYFGAIDVVEISAATVAANAPDISFESGNWKDYCEPATYYGTLDGETAYKATKAASYTYPYAFVENLVAGESYLAKIKYYIPEDQWVSGTELKVFLTDDADDSGVANTADANNGAVLHKSVVAVTEDMTNQWIEVQLAFTHKDASTDTNGKYRLHVCTGNLGGGTYYYLANPYFADPNKAEIDNVSIQANGTVTYTANNADYMLSYEYLDGATVVESGMILAGEFLPKFNLAGVEEPTVKLTASNAYGVAEETVVGVKAKEETPDIGGDEEEGEFAVNAVSIIPIANDSDVPAVDINELADGMYVGINYTNPTENAKQVWLMMAYYDANGLKFADKYLVDLAVTDADITADVFVPENEEEQIDFVAGSTIVKAFVWDVNSVEALCPGYVVD